MPDQLTRRGFLTTATATAIIGTNVQHLSAAGKGRPPVVISSGNGLRATEKAAAMLRDGADTLDAVIAGVNIVEADPNDMSVGYGGLPNEDGVVELDSSVMHGPTHNAGAVAALRNIMHPSKVAKLVAERTDHAMIVGEGALRFARAHGFKEESLLTEQARKAWLRWKESHSDRDDWLAPPPDNDKAQSRVKQPIPFTYGTIHCSALDANGDISGVTTTSGLSYKIPGRVGDSPIIGAGLYVDNEVGAAGGTGRGEAVILNCGAFSVVEQMRNGLAPREACLSVLKRIVDRTKDRRLLRDDGKPDFNVHLYALSKSGQFGAASIWSDRTFAVYEAGRNRIEKSAYLYKRG